MKTSKPHFSSTATAFGSSVKKIAPNFEGNFRDVAVTELPPPQLPQNAASSVCEMKPPHTETGILQRKKKTYERQTSSPERELANSGGS